MNKKIEGGSVSTFEVMVDGVSIPDASYVLSIETIQSVNKISKATITLLDGDPSTQTFTESSSSTFVPGKKISIHAGYDSKNQQIFEGIITKQGLKINRQGTVLVIECLDEAIKTTVGRKTRTFKDKKDSDIISSIIGEYSGLESSIESTTTDMPKQVQYYTTDWDYIVSLAQANGMLVTTINGKISAEKYDHDTSSVLEISYGNNLIDFDSELNSVSQIDQVKATSWDFKTQSLITGNTTSGYAGPGNLSSQTLSEVVGLQEYNLQTSAAIDQNSLDSWSKAQIVKNEYAKIRGEVRIYGNSSLLPAKYITLEGLGDRFNGDHFVSEVRHNIEEGNWISKVTFGMSPDWITENPDVMAPPAAGILPGIRGLFNATVLKNYEDPDGQYRIKIKIPLIDDSEDGIWARLSNFYSSNGAGAFFLPEVGDEVVVGFLNDDPRYPIILGSLYSSSKQKPYSAWKPDEKNSLKGIVSKSNLKIEFDDENKILTIETPDKNQIVFSDKEKRISVQDQNENSVILSQSGITLKSPKDINIEAGQKVTIQGNQGVDVKSSSGDITQSALNLKSKAQIQCELSGAQSTQISSSAQMTLKAAMIMIN